VFMYILSCAVIPSGRLFAQQMTEAPASAQAIDQLTGAIALYPDALIFQILTASKSVEKLKSFAGWMGKNVNLKGSELQDAAEKAGFDAAYVALAPFPQVVKMMAEKPDWTKALGQAFTADENAVFDSIQRLRSQAKAAGNLKTTSQQQVETQTTSTGQQVIVIQPTNPQVIYVPTYNPQTVYVAAAPPSPSGASVAGGAAVGFTAGVIIGASRNSYYHAYDDYWDHREDYYNERKENYQENASQRQSNAQANQSQRQSNAQANQSQRQSNAQANQSQRQSNAQANQSQRQSAASSAQSQGAASQSERQSRGGGQTASGYQSGSTTRAQSSRGSTSLSSSRGGRSRSR
jgi:hypothetical protein